MDDRHQRHVATEDPTLLFEEYLDAREAGRTVELDELAVRAGSRAAELRKRIEVYQSLEELASVCSAEPGGDSGEKSPPEPDPTQVGRFRNLVLIGRGGVSRIFAAEDPLLGRRVALKVLDPARIPTRDARAWMQNEGRSLARLKHPGILTVYEIGEADGLVYIATEYLEGASLLAVLERLRGARSGGANEDGVLGELARELAAITARVELVLELARALAYSHEQGVIHRDVKPGNVILQRGLAPKLIDFGLAHLESEEDSRGAVTGALVGTQGYIAPEQVDRGRTGASEHSDQFALGVVLYEVLTLENPFLREHWHATAAAISRAEPAPPSRKNRAIPADLERICLHALEREPSARYPSLGAFVADLEAFLDHRSISLLPPTPWKIAALWARRHRRDVVLAGSALAAFLLVATLTGLGTHARDRRTFEADLDDARATVARLNSPAQFAHTYARLQRFERAGAELDGSWAALITREHNYANANAVMLACSQRLDAVLDSEFEPSTRMRGALKRDAERRVMLIWGQVLGMDSFYCPGSTFNHANRMRGTAVVSTLAPNASLRVWKHAPHDSLPGGTSLVAVADERELGAGTWRCGLYGADGEVLSEIDLELRPEDAHTPLVLAPAPHDLIAAMQPVATTSISPAPGRSLEVHAFRHSAWIRWADLERVYSPEQIQGLQDTYRHAFQRDCTCDEPALVTYEVAAEFATRLGLRLPTAAEGHVIRERETPPALASGVTIQGEFVLAPALGGTRGALSYAVETRNGTVMHGALSVPEDAYPGKSAIAFRLVLGEP